MGPYFHQGYLFVQHMFNPFTNNAYFAVMPHLLFLRDKKGNAALNIDEKCRCGCVSDVSELCDVSRLRKTQCS